MADQWSTAATAQILNPRRRMHTSMHVCISLPCLSFCLSVCLLVARAHQSHLRVPLLAHVEEDPILCPVLRALAWPHVVVAADVRLPCLAFEHHREDKLLVASWPANLCGCVHVSTCMHACDHARTYQHVKSTHMYPSDVHTHVYSKRGMFWHLSLRRNHERDCLAAPCQWITIHMDTTIRQARCACILIYVCSAVVTCFEALNDDVVPMCSSMLNRYPMLRRPFTAHALVISDTKLQHRRWCSTFGLTCRWLPCLTSHWWLCSIMSQIVIKSYEQCVTAESQGFHLPVLSYLERLWAKYSTPELVLSQ